VSRIDEALRRMKGPSGAPQPAGHDQTPFTPAWSVKDAKEQSGPRALYPAAEQEGFLPPDAGDGGSLRFAQEWSVRLANAATGDPALVEQFRRLAATLHHAQRANGLKSVLVTSATPGDGKTLTAINLALVLSQSYRYKVLLVDADLRRPSIPSVVDIADGTGLSETLRAVTDQKLALVPLAPGLTLLPAGQPIANSIEALTSPRMRSILEQAVQRFDWVVLDAPPVGLATDARLLTDMVDGTLFVIRAGQTQCADVQAALDVLGRDRLLGVVLNGVQQAGPKSYYYGDTRPEPR
jgi:protein-tyrosine kinase